MTLPPEYAAAIKKAPRIWLVIMGKDPYPDDEKRTDIAFLKEDWKDMMRDNCSGGHILRSLGFKLDGVKAEKLKERLGTPRRLFLNMAKSGIVFLNLVYPERALKKSAITQTDHLAMMQDADKVNGPICQKAWLTVLCGQAKKRRWLPGHHATSYMEAVHPDIRNRENTRYPWLGTAWHSWWDQDAIFEWVKPVAELHTILKQLTRRR